MIDPAARARLEWWKASLLDLSAGGNRLLDTKDGRTCLALPGVDAIELASLLADGGAFAIDSGPEPGFHSGRLHVALPPGELDRRLVTIQRAARSHHADRGEHTLWLALGTLVWRDGAHVTHAAPLALLPVDLIDSEPGDDDRAHATRRLVAVDAPDGLAAEANAVLAEKLRRDFDILWSCDAELPALFEAAEGIALMREGWSVDRAARLGCFSLATFRLWRDLETRGDGVLASPVVAQLARSSPNGRPFGLGFAQPSPEAAGIVTAQLDRAASAWASELLAPLDADASQLQAVAAAGAGASFVLQAPPGTGATQTIANLIVHCAAAGKSVLVASHEVVALEAVQQRLASVGLGDFCLELGRGTDRKDGRARVVAQLGRVLERTFRPGSGPIADERRSRELVELRTQLDGHAETMHRIGAFGRSLHEVLGRLVELRTAPRAHLADPDAVGLNAATFEQRRAAIEAVAAAAIAVEPVANHPWRESQLVSWPGHEHVLVAIDEAAAAAAAVHAAVREVAALVPGIVARTRDQLQALGAMATLAAASPRPGGELLTHLRAARTDDIGEQIALVRARGGGTIEVPRDPLAFLALAARHRAIVAEVADAFTDAVDELDAPALWGQLRKWTNSMAPVRFVALRTVRAQVRAAALGGEDELTDAAMITALEAVIAEQACRTALAGAAEPARRWFGQIATADPIALDLDKVDSAVAWAAELRRTFDTVDVIGGDSGRNAAWRSLVAQVAAGYSSPGTSARPSSTDATTAEPTAIPTWESASLAAFARLAETVARWAPAVAELAAATGIDSVDLVDRYGDDHLAAVRERTEMLRHAIAGAPEWVAFHAARQTALAAGVGPAVVAIERNDLAASEVALAWERATLLAWAEAELASSGLGSDEPIAAFPGAALHAHVAAYADLDRAALALVRSRALARFAERVPPKPRGPIGDAGELAALLEELARARPGNRKQVEAAPVTNRPLRELFAAMPTTLARIAPCLLVTPLSAVQYLSPEAKFDIVVLDAASQLPAAEAIGLLARGESAVIIGDSCQLPPTRYFEALRQGRLPDDDRDPFGEPEDAPVAQVDGGAVARELEDVATARGEAIEQAALAEASPQTAPVVATAEAVGQLESILDECLAARLPELRLGCHYRSRHEDLFAFANERFYGDRLQMFVGAADSSELGLALRRVATSESDPDRATRSDRLEAEAVVAEIIARLRDPVQRTRSLGVVTLSRAQQELVEDLLDAARANDPSLASLFATVASEPIAVKNVETSQGLERDVVLLTLAAAAPSGLPLLADDVGRRRLAAAITRAREQLVVFASFEPEAIAAEAAPGLRDLAALLELARAGGVRRQLLGSDTPASPISEAFARALADRGWILRHQVGCGAYKIDIAVVDPSDPERYVLAIEHDGPAYASAPAARDRERLRAQMLGQLGWRVHRFWTLDWWNEPEREIQRAHAAIVTAIAAARQRRAPATQAGNAVIATTTRVARSAPVAGRSHSPPASSPAAAAAAPTGSPAPQRSAPPTRAAASGPVAVPPLEITLPTLATGSRPVRLARNTIPIGPYTAAAIPPGRRTPDDLFAPRHLAELGKVVEQVLAAEAPMHVELLARRVGAYFGIGRVTQRVTSQICAVLEGRARLGGDEPDVVWRLDQDPETIPPVRVAPTGPGGSPTGRRDIAEIPLSELAAAARIVVERANTIATGDLVRDAARLMGFARITDPVTERVAQAVRLAQLRELIAIDAGRASLPAD